MPTRTLNANINQDVASFQMLDTLVDTPDQGPRHLLIFTGIAAARWDSKRDIDPLTVIVRLGTIVEEAPPAHDWTAVVGLSNINNVDSDFIYAINATNVGMDPATNELFLSVDIAVQGAGGLAVLDSFTFQVTVLTEPPKVELDRLLIKGSAFAPTATTQTRTRWEGEVILKSPAPSDVNVFVFSNNPSVAPLGLFGSRSFLAVTVKKTDTRAFFSAPPTSIPHADPVNVTITAALGTGSSTAVLTVLPDPK